jgi:hypothetical protein
VRRSESLGLVKAVVVMAVLTLPALARAEERRTVVSVPVLSVSSNAIAVQAEHPVHRHLSVSLGLGVADGADGDYDAWTGARGAELRVWVCPRQRGFFGGPRLETSVTRTTYQPEDRTIGTGMTIAEGVVIGWRFVILDHVEITPTLGWIAFHDISSTRVPTQTRFPPVASLAIGWVF